MTQTGRVYPYKTQPRPHQRAGLKALAHGAHALLWKPGRGKTKAVIDYLGLREMHSGPQRVVVVCPSIAASSWLEEMQLHAPYPWRSKDLTTGTILDRGTWLHEHRKDVFDGVDLVFVNYEALGSGAAAKRPDGKPYAKRKLRDVLREALTVWKPDVVVLDEMHKVKSHTSKVNGVLVTLRQRTGARFIGLTGTPQPHGAPDIFGQWKVLNPDLFGTHFQGFCTQHVRFGGFAGKEILGLRNPEAFRRLLHSDAHVLEKEDDIELPPLIHRDIKVPLSPAEQKAYATVKKHLMLELADSTLTLQNQLAKLAKLRQISGGWAYDEDHEPHEVGRTKLDTLQEILDECGEEQVVIFCEFRHDVARVSKMLPKAAVITGATKKEDRPTILQDFEAGRYQYLVAQSSTIGIAVNNLKVAQFCVFLSLPFRSDVYEQALGRLHRDGQVGTVVAFHILTTPEDEKILRALRTRRRMEDLLLDIKSEYVESRKETS